MSTPSTAASSLVIPSLAPKAAVSYFALKPTSLSLLTVGLHLKPLSASPPFPSFDVAPRATAASRFLRCHAISSNIDQEEEGKGRLPGDDVERSFSPDLKLVVGNLPSNVDSSQLTGLFESAGNVEVVEVICDKETRRSHGLAVVTMSSVEEAKTAAQLFNGYELNGRALRVKCGPPRRRRGIFDDRVLPRRPTTPEDYFLALIWRMKHC